MKVIIFYFDYKVKKMFVEEEDDSGQKKIVLSSHENFVYKDEIVARITAIDTPEEAKQHLDDGYEYFHIVPHFSFKNGEGIYFDEGSRCYRASHYGFVVLDNSKKLRVIVPLQVIRDKTKAFCLIHPTKFGKIPKYSDIQEMVAHHKIITPVEQRKVETELEKIDSNEKTLTKLIVAQSKSPINGRNEYFESLLDLNRKAGKILSDGRIDFKEVDSIIQVTKGQELLKRNREIRGEDGFDIYGNKVIAIMEPVKGYNKVENIVPSGADEDIYVAAIDGCLEIDKRKIAIAPIAIIKGDVDYDSGNIEFNGSVHVKGSVLPGFSVKAQGDIIIEKNVDDAYIEANGNVIIKMGIAGKGATKVKAGGYLKAKYILNAEVESESVIEIEDSIINSKVFSNDKISVVSQHAKIMGGEIIARHKIVANFAGSAKETTTILTVGRNLRVEHELQEIRTRMAHYREIVTDVMTKIKSSYGTSLFENPKKFISILPDFKKKQCLELLSELTKNNKELKSLAAMGVKVEEKLILDEEPEIIVKEKTYPGTVINIRKRTRKVEQEIANARFYEDPEDKVIRFTAAG